MATKVTTVKIRGQVFDVRVNDDGKFLANVENAQLQADTLDALRTKLMAATKQKSVTMAVPFEQLDSSGKTYPGVIYSIHVNGNLLVKWGDGKKTQERSYSFCGEEYVRPLTEMERSDWAAICRDKAAVQKREHAFHERVKFDVRTAAREEMDKLTAPTPGEIEL